MVECGVDSFGMSRFQSPHDIRQWVLDKLQQLESRVNAVVTGEGLLRSAVGVIRTHTHEGTGEGGVLGAGAVYAAITDPGNGGAIPVTASGYVAIVTGGGETRTLAAPSFAGQELVLYMKTDGGNCVVTCATTINETGNNTITFANEGEAVRLFAVEEGATFRWRMATADGAVLSTV